jgi:PAS domain S-box-containing protein
MDAPDDGAGWEKLFRLVFERTSHPVALLDGDRRIVDVNDAGVALWGGDRRALIGRSMADSVSVAERRQATSEWQAFLRSGEYSGSRDLIRADGSEVPVDFAARLTRIGGLPVAVYVATSRNGAAPVGASPKTDVALTNREREVVTLIALGRETDQIAAQLHISPETVRSHVRNAMSKAGAHTRAQLVAITMCSEQMLHMGCVAASERSSE